MLGKNKMGTMKQNDNKTKEVYVTVRFLYKKTKMKNKRNLYY